MKTTQLLLLALAVVTGGCSILYDTDPYRTGGGDAGPGDMGVTGPSAPTIEISPASPGTRDNLNVVFTANSVDPMGDTVTYEYEWVAGSLTVTTDFVQSSDTFASQMWTVTVTPVAGGRRGTPATAMVTIGNTPPTMGHVGIDTYEPWPDSVIEAFVGDAFDADLQTTLFTYRWQRNGMPVGSNTDELNLAAISANPGDLITLEVTVSDGEVDGNTITVGPAVVRGPFGWRPIEPDTSSRFLPEVIISDADNQRFLLLRDGELWEFSTTDGEEGWARLMTGLPILYSPAIIHDQARDRFLIFGGIDDSGAMPVLTNTLYELSVPQRGDEQWRVVPPNGLRPSARALMGFASDPVGQRGFIYGGGETMSMPYFFTAVGDDFWSMDLTQTDPEFTLVMDGSPPGELLAPMMAVTDDGARAFVMGGLTNTMSFDATDAIHEINLGASPQFSGINVTLESDTGIAGVVPDPRGGGVFVVFGGPGFAMANNEVQRFDFTTRATTSVTIATGASPALTASLQPRGFTTATGHIMLATMGFTKDDGWSVFELAPDDTQLDLIATRVRQGESHPNALDQVSVVYSSRTGPNLAPVMLFGRNGERDTESTGWRWRDSAWERADDGSWGALRSHRGAPRQTFEDRYPQQYIGGYREPEDVEVLDILDFNAPSTLGLDGNNPTGLVPPGLDELFNVIFYDSPDSCSGTSGGNYRVYDPIRSRFWGVVGNSWAPLPDPGVAPTQRDRSQFVSLTAANGEHRIVVFGGYAAGTPLGDVYTLDPCLSTASAIDTSVPSTGTPSARTGGAMTRDFGTLLGGVNRARGYLFGGADADPDDDVSMTTLYDDLYSVELSNTGGLTWTAMPDGGERPPGRAVHVLFWDTEGGRLILFGGRGEETVIIGDGTSAQWRSDTWEYRPQ